MSLVKKLFAVIKTLWKFLPYLLQSIYFNFHYLPFKQACMLPILLYKPHFIRLKGKIVIDSPSISFGMIKLGLLVNTCNQNNGVSMDNRGGTIVFKGSAIFANDSYFMIMSGAVLTLGRDLDCNCKIKCAKSIEIGDETWIAYDSMIMDSEWHALTDMTTGKLLNKEKPVKIGKHNFISFGCLVLKGTVTPDNATFTPHSTLNKVYEEGEYPLFGGNPCELIDEGYYMDHKNN
jgi:acetyltransferase-like isoleucine patch superfamily enzyme